MAHATVELLPARGADREIDRGRKRERESAMATLKGFPALRLLMLASLILANFVLTQQVGDHDCD